jgi:hypothetical protein
MVIKDHGMIVARTKPLPKGAVRTFWVLTAFTGFFGSAVLMALGLTVSALSALDVIAPSHGSGYAAVILLSSSFIFAFLGAHSLDRLSAPEETRETGASPEHNSYISRG